MLTLHVLRTGLFATATCVAFLAPRAALADGELLLGGLRLADLQADVEPGDNALNGPDATDLDLEDGGWDWYVNIAATEHSSSASSTNLYGITAMGALHAYVWGSPDPRLLRTALITEEQMDLRASSRDPDIAFRLFLSHVAVDPTFAETARTLWIAKMKLEGGAQAYGERVRTARGVADNGGLYPWDLMWAIVSARLLENRFPNQGFASDALSLAFVIYSDLQSVTPVFRMEDPSQNFHTLGLAGITIAMRYVGEFDSLRDKAYDKLLSAQNPDGGFTWNSVYPDSDPQVAAYAVMAASVMKRDPRSIPAAQRASNWLATLQRSNGGFEYFPPSGDEYTEIDSEILMAFARVPPSSGLAAPSGHQWTKRPPSPASVFAD